MRGELTADRIVIAVKDTGIGIAESDLAHIFDEFRNESNHNHKHGGTGLDWRLQTGWRDAGKITVESQLDRVQLSALSCRGESGSKGS